MSQRKIARDLQQVFNQLNQRGQGLIEYLIIVALIAVGTIGIMRIVGQAVGSRFATISDAIQGERRVHAVDAIDANLLRKKDLGDFMNGVGSANGGGNGPGGQGVGGGNGGLGSP